MQETDTTLVVAALTELLQIEVFENDTENPIVPDGKFSEGNSLGKEPFRCLSLHTPDLKLG